MIERLLVRLIGDGSSYTSMVAQATTQTNKFESSVSNASKTVNKIGAGTTKLGKKLTVGVTAPLVGFGALATKEFAKFDQAMTESTSIMDVTDKQIAKMRQTALDLSSGGKALQTPTELAKAYFFLASAGLDAERSMAALPAVAKFATAGAFDMALATDLLTDAQTAMGLEGANAAEQLKNLVKVSDIFVAANQSANTSVQQVSEAMTSDAGTAARQMGQEIESVVAVLEAYASAGKKGAEAGNLYGRATRLLTSASRKNAEEFERLGIKVVGNDGAYRDFIDIIKDMEKAFSGMSGPQVAANLELLGFKALAQKSITPLIGLGGAMEEYKTKLLEAGGATELVATKQMTSFSNQIQVLKNQSIVLAISLGQALAPIILKVAQVLKKVTSEFRALDPTIQTNIVTVALLLGVLGPVLIILGSLISSFGTLVTVVGAATGAVAGLLTPLGWVIALVVGAVAAIRMFSGSWENAGLVIKDFANNMVNHIIFGLRVMTRSITVFAGWLGTKFTQVWEVDFVSSVISGIKAAANVINKFAIWVGKKIAAALTGKQTGTLQDLTNQLQGDLKAGTQAGKNGNLLEALKQIRVEESANLVANQKDDGLVLQTPIDNPASTSNTMETNSKIASDIRELVTLTKKQLNKAGVELSPLGLGGI